MSNQKSKKKTGLNVTSVSKDHWSNRGGIPKVEGTRLVVTILNGKGLLASDVLTGKSDPICFLWCGLPTVSTASKSTVDEFMDVTDDEECAKIGILRTKVCPTTLEPIWNEDIVFPLAVDDTYSLTQLRCLIYVRDEDIDDDDNSLSYDELGMCEISVKDILMHGKPLRTSIAYISKQLELKSSPKMKKCAEGYIKVTCTLIFDEADTQKMYPEVGDGIKSLDVFLQKFQQILKDRSDKENGPQTPWGRTSSPLQGFRRTIGSDTGSGEATGRTTYRGRSARGRSQSPSLQVAPTVRSSSIAMLEGADDVPTDGTVSSRPANVPKLDYRKKILLDDKPSLEDVKEGDEGNDSELNIISGSPLQAHANGAKISPLESTIPGDLKQKGALGNAARDREHEAHSHMLSLSASEISGRSSSISSVSHFDKVEPLTGRDSLEGGEAEGGAAETKESSRNAISTKAQGKDKISRILPPSYSSLKGAEGQGQGSSPVQVQGNAAVAARALREVATNKDAKQLSLDYISSLSQASVAELSVLLRSMEESRKAKVNSSSAQSVSNAISESKSQVAGEAKGALPVSTRKLSSSGSSSRVRSPGTVDILVKDIDTASLSASGRPDLKQFKRQQQEAHRRAKEAEFFKSRGIAPPVMAADLDSPASSSNANSQRPMNRDQHRDQRRDRDRDGDGGSMPPVELYLKAPNSDAILRATLLGNGDDMRFQSHNNSLATGKSSDKSAVARAHKESESQVSSTSPDGSNQAPFPYPVGGGDRSHHQQRQSEGSSSREDVKPLLQSKSHPRLKGLASLGPIHMSSGAVSRPSSSSRVKETRESGAGSGSGSGGSIEWSTVQRLFDQGDAVGAFSIVVERGELEDLARAMQLLGPKPHLLSASIRNRVYDGIATILASSQVRGSSLGDRETERCLFWVLALFRNNISLDGEEGHNQSGRHRDQGFLGGTLHGHTRRDLSEALELVSQEKSKKGLLAALLLHYF